MKKLKELLMKKLQEGKVLSKDAKSAKCDMLDELDGITKGAMADKLKKVTIAASSTEGLKEGLKLALDKLEDGEEESEEMKEESEETSDEKILELKKKIKELKG